jgi:hypothetical protein
METNPIIEELNAFARMDFGPEQKAYYEQRAKDARPVECVRMCDVFTQDQMAFWRYIYSAKKKMCYKNASDLVMILSDLMPARYRVPPVKYVEGLVYSRGLLAIDHAFVKVGDKYIDPTFELALQEDVRKEMYVSLIELTPQEMGRFQAETGMYGDLYQYAFLKQHRPDLAARWAE